MTRFIAELGLLAMSIGVMLGNMWFTFGLWPQSWLSFVVFAVLSVILVALRLGLDKD